MNFEQFENDWETYESQTSHKRGSSYKRGPYKKKTKSSSTYTSEPSIKREESWSFILNNYSDDDITYLKSWVQDVSKMIEVFWNHPFINK